MVQLLLVLSSSKWPIYHYNYHLLLIPLLLLLLVLPSPGIGSLTSVNNNNFNIHQLSTTTAPAPDLVTQQPQVDAATFAVQQTGEPNSVPKQNIQPSHQNGSAPLNQPHPKPPVASSASNNNNNNDDEASNQQQPPRRQGVAGDEYMVGVGIADITGPAADINLVSLLRLLLGIDGGGSGLSQFLVPSAASPGAPTLPASNVIVEDLIQISYPSVADLTNVKLLLKINFKSLLLQTQLMNELIRWAMPNQIKMQVEYTYVNLVVQLVLRRLQESYGALMFNESNVMMTATHSHSCPGGFFQYMLYNIPSAGFISQTLEALVDGMVRSIDRAVGAMKPARLYYNEAELLDASINRSPTSYDNNPPEERQTYQHNTDKTMHLVKIVDRSGEPIGMINWFAVHGTSMNNTNKLISSDNKGYASVLFEQEFNKPSALPGRGTFVAIFAQANEGDVSPNTMGPRCIDSGLPCDLATSTCNSANEKCIAFGPGKDMFESTKIIAYKQYDMARRLFLGQTGSLTPIGGPVRFVHEHIDMTRQQVPLYKSVIDLAHRQKPKPQISINSTYQTCPAALGYSFAAGTTDGPGAFDFQQGDTVASRYWNMVRDFLRRPTQAQIKCHLPKPILLDTGEMDFPYMWHPKVVPTQILMVGQLAIVGLPGEFTTMAGRRVRQAVRATLVHGASRPQDPFGAGGQDEADDGDDDEAPETDEDRNAANRMAHKNRRLMIAKRTRALQQQQQQQQFAPPDFKVVLSGLSNIYTSYVTTIEEFEMQRYEGASTLYGPHTLQAYVNQFRRLAAHLVSGEPVAQDGQPQPPDLTRSLFTLKPGVLYDTSPHGRSFGDVLQDANQTRPYRCQELVSVTFVAGHPRNDLRQEDSFLYVDRYLGNGTWSTIATDASWDTKFVWKRTSTMWGESTATVQWDIPHNCQSGYYRIRHYGAHKSLLQTVSHYSGQSATFMVLASNETIESLIERKLGSIAAARRFHLSRS